MQIDALRNVNLSNCSNKPFDYQTSHKVQLGVLSGTKPTNWRQPTPLLTLDWLSVTILAKTDNIGRPSAMYFKNLWDNQLTKVFTYIIKNIFILHASLFYWRLQIKDMHHATLNQDPFEPISPLKSESIFFTLSLSNHQYISLAQSRRSAIKNSKWPIPSLILTWILIWICWFKLKCTNLFIMAVFIWSCFVQVLNLWSGKNWPTDPLSSMVS